MTQRLLDGVDVTTTRMDQSCGHMAQIPEVDRRQVRLAGRPAEDVRHLLRVQPRSVRVDEHLARVVPRQTVRQTLLPLGRLPYAVLAQDRIRNARKIQTWKGREDGKPEPSARSACAKVAKNYLTEKELAKLNRLVGRLCLRAEDIADEEQRLSLTQWSNLVEIELSTGYGQIAA